MGFFINSYRFNSVPTLLHSYLTTGSRSDTILSGAQTRGGADAQFNDDGTQVLMGNHNIALQRNNVPTPWDISSITTFSNWLGGKSCPSLSQDGTHFLVKNSANPTTITNFSIYRLNTAFDFFSGATNMGIVTALTTGFRAHFGDNGRYLIKVNDQAAFIWEMNTPYDPASASTYLGSFSYSAFTDQCRRGISKFAKNGLALIRKGQVFNNFKRDILAVPWDITTVISTTDFTVSGIVSNNFYGMEIGGENDEYLYYFGYNLLTKVKAQRWNYS